ncbi:MAG: VOC family protein [Gammaproteobacteria bacterium]|nr:VOC family protein [Gammaproteobacteria bacterium]MDH3535347.1 VOC family protein [Gammaproteobacteria bacterium]
MIYHAGMNQLDHIVIAADSLQQGVDYLHQTLGVAIPAGGFHQTMGTHNHLMQLANDAYLEVIAIDPQAQAPPRPRWFGLDEATIRASLKRQPRLITWVMNTPDIHRLVGDAGFDIGVPTRLSRDNLEWEIALTDDGRLLAGGMLPYCIQWHSSPHPSRGMADLGCVLHALTIYHNRPRWLAERLDAIDASHLVQIEPLPDSESPYLMAAIETPGGVVTL